MDLQIDGQPALFRVRDYEECLAMCDNHADDGCNGVNLFDEERFFILIFFRDK